MWTTLIRLSVFACALVGTSAASADVLTVGPAGEFADIQSAVAAAFDFDIVLVSSGDYGGFDVGDVALTVVAETGATVVVNGPSSVTNLSTGRVVSLIGLAMTNEYVSGTSETEQLVEPTLLLQGDAGSVRVENGSIAANSQLNFEAGQALRVVQCADVAFARVDVMGGHDGAGFIFAPFGHVSPPGASFSSSIVVLHGGSLSGTSVQPTNSSFGSPLPTEGTAGLVIDSGSVFLSGTSVVGGQGSRATQDCEFAFGIVGGDGGPGLQLVGPSAVVRQLDTDVTGGLGGPAAPDTPQVFCTGNPGGAIGPAMDVQAGLDLPVAGTARSFSMQSPAREHEPITLDFSGEPGDLAGVFWGVAPGTLFKQSLHGHALIDFSLPTFLILLGPLPATGELTVPLAFEELGPGWEGITLPFQAIYSGGPSQLYFGAPAQSVILDEGQ